MTMVSPGYGEQPLRQEDSLIPPSPPIPHNNYPQQEQDRAHFEVDKRAVYRHPLFPLLALLFEKCEVATQTGECPSSESFNLDLQAFIQHQKQDSKPFFSNSPEIDNLMLMALQVLRIHLLELEKVQELCRDFCRRYIGCLKGKLHSESLLRAEYSDEGESPPATPCNGPSQIMQDPSIAASVLSPLVMAGYSSKVMHGVRENGNSSMPMGNIHPIPGSTPLGHIGSSQVPSGSSVRITGVSGGGSGSLSFDEDDDEEDAGPGRKKAKRGILPKHATTILKSWLFQHIVHPYPTEEEKRVLASQTQLTLLQVNNWFINARRRILQPMLDASQGGGSSQDSQPSLSPQAKRARTSSPYSDPEFTDSVESASSLRISNGHSSAEDGGSTGRGDSDSDDCKSRKQ